MDYFDEAEVVSVKREILTKEMAEQLLNKNHNNRNLSIAKAVRYANDMSKGAWADVGDVVRIDTEGNLIDGQHRCKAVVLSGKDIPITMIIIKTKAGAMNLPIDIHSKRKTSEIAGISSISSEIFTMISRDILSNRNIESGVSSIAIKKPEWSKWIEENITTSTRKKVSQAAVKTAVFCLHLYGINLCDGYRQMISLDLQDQRIGGLYKKIDDIPDSISGGSLRKRLFCTVFAYITTGKQRISPEDMDAAWATARAIVSSALEA
jgi:hypothetical protein